MPILHHLARTGGTLISRCLASMDGVCLLSEINPGGTDRFNPLRQAANWYGLLAEDEVREIATGDSVAFVAAIELIAARAKERGLMLVIRDWSHLDWIGFPFTQPQKKSAWNALSMPALVGCDRPSDANSARPVEKDEVHGNLKLMRRCATVRHPVDQYLSMKRLGALAAQWDDMAVWRGMREFAEFVQTMTWIRFEDFVHRPDAALRVICDVIGLTYDDGWQLRWQDYHKITGDASQGRRRSIVARPRTAVDPSLWNSLRNNGDFFATLELLGYPTPEPLRRRWYAASELPADRLEGADKRRLDWDEEVVRARQAYEDAGGDVDSSLRLAEASGWIGQVDEAADVLLKLVQFCEAGLEVEVKSLPRILSTTCDMLDRAERKYESIPIRRRWAQVDPTHQGNLFHLSLLLAGVGEIDESLSYCRRLLDVDVRHTGAAANYLLYMNYSDRYSAAEISNEHFRVGMHFTQPSDSLPPRPRMAAEKIRVGYLGSDFYTHPVGKIILPILQSHDLKRCEINIYHDGKKSDATTNAIKESVDYFTSVQGWADDRLLESVRLDDLDVLIDLGGYTGGGNRLRVLAKRLAPVQASFLGYPHTSAIPSMDYRFTDRFADPPGLTDHLYGERLVWLEHAHLAWRPYGIAEDIVSVPSSQPTLGVFNNVAKISPTAISTYAEILRRVPRATILFKYGDRFAVSTLRDRYRQVFATHGISPDRLQFRTQTETLKEHLQTMANVDLALDSFPYQGTMTSLECLCVGTPIISCCGNYYAHRATSAMMIRMGLQELVADDRNEYVEIAVEMLHDRGRLPGLRKEIQHRFDRSALTDPTGLARELESTFEEWVR
ncbi:O-linked N-acetylglucosamine transferase family protein [Allorhodopirellula heiligendammensis]|nr:hypothetical protein [Allorhodopirellula heiligendammensis]